jgi:hypothetical protein
LEEGGPVHGERCRLGAQRGMLRALADAVTLAGSFDLNDGPAHHLTSTLKCA